LRTTRFSSHPLKTSSRLADISKINAVAIGSVAKLDAVLAANIAKVNGLVFSATVGASAAFSVRLLNSLLGVTYNGAAMRVRRDTGGGAGDDDEADVAFDSGVVSLDSAISNASSGVTATTLGGFINVGTVGGTTYTNADSLTVTAVCVVVEWKDQSGSSNDASQSTHTKQPTIHEGTVNTDLVKDNGQPAVKFVGTAHQALRTGSYAVELSQNDASVFTVHNSNAVGNVGYVLAESDRSSPYSSNFIYGTFQGPAILWVNATTFGSAQTGQVLSGFDYDGTNFQAHLNMSASGSSGTATVNTEVNSYTYIGSQAQDGSGFSFTGTMQEIITYKSNQSSNRSGIEGNINAYFQIGNFGTPTSGLLSTYTGAAAAYSVRQLANTAALCMRVRRDNDDAEQDFGFDANGDLDTAAIATFVGSGNNGYVSKWYDQSGNGNDAAQSTNGNQPQIYDGSAVITENGKPVLKSHSGTVKLVTGVASGVTDQTIFSVNRLDRTGVFWGINDSSASFALAAENGSGSTSIRGAFTNFDTRKNGAAYSLSGKSRDNLYDDFVAQHLLTVELDVAVGSFQQFGYWTSPDTTYAMWSAQELILYPSSDKPTTSERTAIETDINNYFSIY